MSTDEIRSQAKLVHTARQLAFNAQVRLNQARQQWEQENADLINDAKLRRQEAEGAEQDLRDLAIDEYNHSGEKALGYGVKIRTITRLDYDGERALDWAKQHQMFLQLDRKGFDAFAKTNAYLPFVSISEEPQATIATDLAKALGIETPGTV